MHLQKKFQKARGTPYNADGMDGRGNLLEVKTYPIEGLKLVKPKVFRDARGFFLEAYNQSAFEAIGIDCFFVQDNHSQSVKNTLRGLHFQVKQAQDKLVRVVQGEIFDVAVDLRPDSRTFGQWEGVVLSAENHLQFFVPKGFAHGFQVLSDTASVIYKCSDFYSPQDERGLLWSDPDLDIAWPGKGPPTLSEKDRNNPTFETWQKQQR